MICTFLAYQDKFIHEVAGRLCFQPVSVSHSVITHDALDLTIQGFLAPAPSLDMGPHCTCRDPTPKPRPQPSIFLTLDMFKLVHYEVHRSTVDKRAVPTEMFSCRDFPFFISIICTFYIISSRCFHLFTSVTSPTRLKTG